MKETQLQITNNIAELINEIIDFLEDFGYEVPEDLSQLFDLVYYTPNDVEQDIHEYMAFN